QASRVVAFKVVNGFGVVPYKPLDGCRRLIAASESNDLGRRAEQPRHVHEIGVERNENQPVRLLIAPNRTVARLLQSEQTHLTRAGKQIVQLSAKLEAQVL